MVNVGSVQSVGSTVMADVSGSGGTSIDNCYN